MITTPCIRVHALNFVYQVLLDFVRAFDAQDVVRRDGTFGERAAGTYVVVVLNEDLVGELDQVAAFFTALGGDDDLLVATLDGSQTYHAVDLGNNSRVGRVARLEEFGNARQTTGDVARFRAATRDLYQDLAGFYLGSVVHHQVGADRQVVRFDDVALGIVDDDRGDEFLVLGFGNDLFLEARLVVDLYLVGLSLFDVLVGDLTGCFGEDQRIVRIPLADHVSLGYLLVGFLVQESTVGNIVGGKHELGLGIQDVHFRGAGDDDVAFHPFLVLSGDGAQVVEFDDTVGFGLDAGFGSGCSGGTSLVEGTEGKLRTRFTDGLGCDHADRFAFLNHAAGSQVAPVTFGTDTVTCLAGKGRTDFHRFHAGLFDRFGDRVGDLFSGMYQDVSVAGIFHIVQGYATQDAAASVSRTTSFSFKAETSIPRRVPQSSSLMITSCATSTRRRVR